MEQQLTIGSRIKQRRRELGLTQTQIKEKTGISTGNLSEIENGIKLPSASAIISLSNILQCTTDWLLKGNSPFCDNFSLSLKERQFFNDFRQISVEDQNELIEILEIKLRKTLNSKEKNTHASSVLTATGSDT